MRSCASRSAVSLIVLPTLFVRIDLTYRNSVDFKFAFNLGLACLLAAVPSLLAGTVIALAIRGYAGSVGRVYAFDLVGAGLGALVVVPLMWLLDVADPHRGDRSGGGGGGRPLRWASRLAAERRGRRGGAGGGHRVGHLVAQLPAAAPR